MAKYYGKEYEQKKQKPPKRDVLRHLKERGPWNYEALYVLFDLHRTANIAPVLHELLEWNYIQWDAEHKNVEITDSGLRLLKDDAYWVS